MDNATAVAKCATGPIVSHVGILDAMGHGTAEANTGSRYYGLLADRSAILPIRTMHDLVRHEWAGYWQGATSVGIRRA